MCMPVRLQSLTFHDGFRAARALASLSACDLEMPGIVHPLAALLPLFGSPGRFRVWDVTPNLLFRLLKIAQ